MMHNNATTYDWIICYIMYNEYNIKCNIYNNTYACIKQQMHNDSY